VAEARKPEARELADQGYEAFKAGDADRSRDLNERSLALAREAGDSEAIVRALAGLMRLGLRARDFAEVERLAAECMDVARGAGNPALERMPLHMRAESARMQGELAQAAELYDASIALNEQLGNEAMVAVEQGNKGWVEIAVRRLDEAERLFRASLEATDDDYGVAFCLLGLARVELERGNERGLEILGAAESLLERAGLVWDPAEQPEYD
jgi:tetratricopeptide (TPR) repeat protein